jgi:predicted secreted acid phosphatase
MKSRNLIYLSSLFCIFAVHIAADEEKVDNSVQVQSMLAVLYAQSSAEYDANNLQTYTGAKLSLDLGLDDKNWTAAIEQKRIFQKNHQQ